MGGEPRTAFLALDSGTEVTVASLPSLLALGPLLVKAFSDTAYPLVEAWNDVLVVGAIHSELLQVGDLILDASGTSLALARVRRVLSHHGRPLILGGPDFSRGGANGLRPLEPVARVLAIQKKDGRIDLEAAPWRAAARLGSHLGSGVLRGLHHALLALRAALRPSFPGMALADLDQLRASVAAKYSRPEEITWFTHQAAGGLEEWEQLLLTRYMERRGRILNIGCGVGREALAWARQGFEVVGVDLVQRLTAEARQRAERAGLRATFLTGDVAELAPALGGFEYVVFSRGVYSHIPSRAARAHILRTLYDLLHDDGLLVFSATVEPWNTRWLSRFRWVNLLRRYLGGAEAGDILRGNVSWLSDPAALCYLHVFANLDEVATEIRAAGLCGRYEEEMDVWVIRRSRP